MCFSKENFCHKSCFLIFVSTRVPQRLTEHPPFQLNQGRVLSHATAPGMYRNSYWLSTDRGFFAKEIPSVAGSDTSTQWRGEWIRDCNRLGANPLEIKGNMTSRVVQVIQSVDCKLCQSSVAFNFSCTCSLLSLKIMPKKISKEPGDCTQSEEFRGGVK